MRSVLREDWRTHYERKKIYEGLEVQHGEDGHWLCFKANGKRAMICVESKTVGITKDVIIEWIEEQLEKEA